MKAVTVNGLVLHVDDHGPRDGLPLVFSNSLGTDYRVWDPLLPHLPDGLRLIRYDKRGHGLSTCPDAPYVMADHMKDLADLMDALEVSGAIIVGLSVGGLIAQSLAAARPDLVKGLVLCDTGHKIGTPDIWNPRIEAVEKGGIAALSDAILERWFSKSFHTSRPDDLALWRAMVTRTPAQGYIGTCAAIRDTDLTASSSALDLPTVCVVGSEDSATTPDLVRSMAELIGGHFVEIDGAGHLPCVEAPETLAGIIESFLQEHRFV